MVGTIGTIHAIEARENVMDARVHPVSSYLNSPAPLLSDCGHAGWFYPDDCDRPKPVSRQDDRDDYTKTRVSKHSCENAFFFARGEHICCLDVLTRGKEHSMKQNRQTKLRKRVFFTRREHIFCLFVITRGIEHFMK